MINPFFKKQKQKNNQNPNSGTTERFLWMKSAVAALLQRVLPPLLGMNRSGGSSNRRHPGGVVQAAGSLRTEVRRRMVARGHLT